jgi:hypothetical protein
MKLSSAFVLTAFVQLLFALFLLCFTSAPLLPSGLLVGVGTILMGLGIFLMIDGE